MKILATSDWHGDESTSGVARFKEVEESAFKTVQAAIFEKVDLYAFLGDLCDPDCGSSAFRCVRLALECVRRLDKHKVRSVWIAGNHDVIEDGSAETTLSPLRVLNTGYATLFEEPAVLSIPEHEVIVAMFPFPHRTRRYDADASARAVFTKESRSKVLAIGHLQLKGAVMGSESREMARGQDLEFPAQELKQGAEAAGLPLLMMNGHYHHAQKVNGVHVPGSLVRLRHDEEQNRPGYLLAEF